MTTTSTPCAVSPPPGFAGVRHNCGLCLRLSSPQLAQPASGRNNLLSVPAVDARACSPSSLAPSLTSGSRTPTSERVNTPAGQENARVVTGRGSLELRLGSLRPSRSLTKHSSLPTVSASVQQDDNDDLGLLDKSTPSADALIGSAATGKASFFGRFEFEVESSTFADVLAEVDERVVRIAAEPIHTASSLPAHTRRESSAHSRATPISRHCSAPSSSTVDTIDTLELRSTYPTAPASSPRNAAGTAGTSPRPLDTSSKNTLSSRSTISIRAPDERAPSPPPLNADPFARHAPHLPPPTLDAEFYRVQAMWESATAFAGYWQQQQAHLFVELQRRYHWLQLQQEAQRQAQRAFEEYLAQQQQALHHHQQQQQQQQHHQQSSEEEYAVHGYEDENGVVHEDEYAVNGYEEENVVHEDEYGLELRFGLNNQQEHTHELSYDRDDDHEVVHAHNSDDRYEVVHAYDTEPQRSLEHHYGSDVSDEDAVADYSRCNGPAHPATPPRAHRSFTSSTRAGLGSIGSFVETECDVPTSMVDLQVNAVSRFNFGERALYACWDTTSESSPDLASDIDSDSESLSGPSAAAQIASDWRAHASLDRSPTASIADSLISLPPLTSGPTPTLRKPVHIACRDPRFTDQQIERRHFMNKTVIATRELTALRQRSAIPSDPRSSILAASSGPAQVSATATHPAGSNLDIDVLFPSFGSALDTMLGSAAPTAF